MNPKLFIIEGPDQCGKSTLARFISRVVPAAYIHASGKKSLFTGMFDYHAEILLSAKVTMEVGRLSVVLDRHWPSEMVYGKLFRPHISADYRFSMIWAMLKEMHPIYIFCGREDAYENQLTQPENDHVYAYSEFSQVVGEYVALTNRMMLGKIHEIGEYCCYRYNIKEHGADMGVFVERILNDGIS